MRRRDWLVAVGLGCLAGLIGCARTEEKATTKSLPSNRLPPLPKDRPKR